MLGKTATRTSERQKKDKAFDRVGDEEKPKQRSACP